MGTPERSIWAKMWRDRGEVEKRAVENADLELHPEIGDDDEDQQRQEELIRAGQKQATLNLNAKVARGEIKARRRPAEEAAETKEREAA